MWAGIFFLSLSLSLWTFLLYSLLLLIFSLFCFLSLLFIPVVSLTFTISLTIYICLCFFLCLSLSLSRSASLSFCLSCSVSLSFCLSRSASLSFCLSLVLPLSTSFLRWIFSLSSVVILFPFYRMGVFTPLLYLFLCASPSLTLYLSTSVSFFSLSSSLFCLSHFFSFYIFLTMAMIVSLLRPMVKLSVSLTAPKNVVM